MESRWILSEAQLLVSTAKDESTWPLSYGFCCRIKTPWPRWDGGEWVYFATFRSHSITEGSQGRNGSRGHGWVLLIGLLSVACSAFLSFLFFFLLDRVSRYSPGCTGTYSVDQDGPKLRDPPASVSQVLGLKACTTTTQLQPSFL